MAIMTHRSWEQPAQQVVLVGVRTTALWTSPGRGAQHAHVQHTACG